MGSGFYIQITNGLLDPKHVEAMGEAVWLYMWLVDKSTSQNENGEGKVLGNKPIVYENDIEPALGIPRRTYTRWISRLRNAGYIKTLRTPAGLIIVITKAKKRTKKGSAKSAHHQIKKSDVPKTNIPPSDEPNRPTDEPKTSIDEPNRPIQYIKNKTIQGLNKDYISTDVDIGDLSAAGFKELVSKLYYQVIKVLDIPKLNNKNIRGWIDEMASDPEKEKVINYLLFLRDQYKTTHWRYKPQITEAMHIYSKRAKIRETFAEHIRQDTKPKGRGFTVGK